MTKWICFFIFAPLFFLAFCTPVFSVNSSSDRVTFVIDGSTYEFCVAEGVSADAEVHTAKVIEIVDEETLRIEIEGKEVLCYISFDKKSRVEIKPGMTILVKRNAGGQFNTEWDFLAVGSVVEKGYDYYYKTNTIILQPPPAEAREEEPFSEAILSQVEELTITTTSLPDAAEDTPYSQTLSVSGGISPYSWSISSGDLPSGLDLSSDGVISGTPSGNTVGDTYSFTVEVTDSNGDSATRSLSIKISGYVTVDWTQANTSGFGSAANIGIYSMATFGSYIYRTFVTLFSVRHEGQGFVTPSTLKCNTEYLCDFRFIQLINSECIDPIYLRAF